ncbi:hypothetical protein ACJMK2_043009 [Sinanodonta woodiana]|uniref:Uncharacterized protein n=1 Tax=Sinanodonta woodiana TaxID=1069815 RepID=A0ABD3VXA9_SINWO
MGTKMENGPTPEVITNEDILPSVQSAQASTSACGDETVLDSINDIEAFVLKQTVKSKKQQSILDFVKKP